jgi:hypothetical protein
VQHGMRCRARDLHADGTYGIEGYTVDDIVLKGMARWPNVPAVYGWLALDRRGNWLLRGEKISNETVLAYIGRNYARDERGRWFLQNGPQRVYVDLDYTPFVYRVVRASGGTLALEAQNGQCTERIAGAWIDEHGALLLDTDCGVGLVHDKDLDALLEAFTDENGAPLDEDRLENLLHRLLQGESTPLFVRVDGALLPLRAIESKDVPERFAFVAKSAGESIGEAGTAA